MIIDYKSRFPNITVEAHIFMIFKLPITRCRDKRKRGNCRRDSVDDSRYHPRKILY